MEMSDVNTPASPAPFQPTGLNIRQRFPSDGSINSSLSRGRWLDIHNRQHGKE